MESILSKLDACLDKGLIDEKLYHSIRDFADNCAHAAKGLAQEETALKSLNTLVGLILDGVRRPYQFSIFHESVRQPFDYYQFGLDFIRPFIDFERSKIVGLPILKTIREQLNRSENVILLANHQTEPDPQIISLLLENIDPKLSKDMIFIAGHRVTSDPMAIPMSLGRNLLCIYSKKHISYPPEDKEKKVLHNQRTLKQMQDILNEGGACIYVAPSGGRDRADAWGQVHVAPFDPQSVELFYLLSSQAKRPTHFYPLTLQTYHLMPPPCHVEKEIGEKRSIHFTPVFLAIGLEIDMENFPGSENLDKRAKRKLRADYIWRQVDQKYKEF